MHRAERIRSPALFPIAFAPIDYETTLLFPILRRFEILTNRNGTMNARILQRFTTILAFFPLLAIVTAPLSGQTPGIRTLHPYPKHAFERTGNFLLDGTVVIVAADTGGTARAVAWLRRHLGERFGLSPEIVAPEAYDGSPSAIVLGLTGSPGIDDRLARVQPPGEPSPDSVGNASIVKEAYILDVSPKEILIAAAGPDGLFHGVTSLFGLAGAGGLPRPIRSCHILDYPDYPVRWAFSQHNLRGPGAMTTLRNLLDSMAFSKMNGMQQTDFKYAILNEQPDYYFDSVARFKAMCEERNIEVIPGVAPIGWSSGILWHDPNLAEGFPAEALYVVEGGSGRIIPDPRVTIPNGGFENTDAQGRSTGWNFYDEENLTTDRIIFRSGSASGHGTNFTAQGAGNSRFNRRVACSPNRYYTMTIWVRTENLVCDEVRLHAIGQSLRGEDRTLTYTAYPISGTTNGWKKLEARFNTLESDFLLLYCGVWGGKSGSIWWDDWTIQDAGLLNVLRREGTPLHVYDAGSGREYVEGIDFEPVIDSIMLESHGEFGPWHTPPTIRLMPGSAISGGDTLRVTWFHPLTTVANENVNGSVMVCPSEEKTYGILREEIERVNALYRPANWFMGHDEIRSLNRDSSCLRRDASAAEILADNARRIAEMIDSTAAGSRISVWSDMFDSLHNAHADYYLINGDLTGVWNGIPKDLTIVNWNGGNKRESLDFFSSNGFEQIAAPFLPSPNAATIREWRLAAGDMPSVRGMMYVTWSNGYGQFRPFGYYSWSAGPYIIHRPHTFDEFDSLLAAVDSITFTAEILDDPYDAGDEISTAFMRFTYTDRANTAQPMRHEGNDIWSVRVATTDLRTAVHYSISCRNSQFLGRQTPNYLLKDETTLVEEMPEKVQGGGRMDLRAIQK